MKKVEQPDTIQITFDGEAVNIKTLYRVINKHAPQKLLDELAAIGDTLEQMSWRCGWKTDELYRHLEANGHKQNYLAVCFYVSAAKLRHNRSQNTVKAWAMTARFFPEKTAKKYGNDVLPFSTFTYAASWGEAIAPPEIMSDEIQYMWQAVLRYALQKYHEGGDGRSPSVEHLKTMFEGRRERKSSEERHIETLIPDSDTAIEIDMSRIVGSASEVSSDLFVQVVVQALRVVSNAIPKLGEKFPEAARTLSGILSQLGQVMDKLERGEDYTTYPESD